MSSKNDYIAVLILAECTDSVRFPNPNTNPAGRCEVTERLVIKMFTCLHRSHSFSLSFYATNNVCLSQHEIAGL
jgi:hypothetical protein